MIAIIRKNFQQVFHKKGVLCVFTLLLVGAIAMSLYSQSHDRVVASVAVVNQKRSIDSKHLNIIYVEEKPDMADLVMNKYDAILLEDGSLESIKSEEVLSNIEQLLAGYEYPKTDEDLGLMIIKAITMFLFMMTNFLMFTLGSDFELKMIDRILKTPVSSFQYLLANLMFTTIFTSFLAIIALGFFRVFGFDIGYSLFKYATIITVITFLASTLSSVFYILFKKIDTASMFSQIFVIMTSLLSGSFGLLKEEGSILASVFKGLPQKLVYDSLAHDSLLNIQMLYVMIWILISFIFSYTLMKKAYKS